MHVCTYNSEDFREHILSTKIHTYICTLKNLIFVAFENVTIVILSKGGFSICVYNGLNLRSVLLQFVLPFAQY